MKISKGTIVRTILVAIVVINLILKSLGIHVINVDETTVQSFVETVIQVAVIVVSYWKNNSVSKNAIKADEFLKGLKESEE